MLELYAALGGLIFALMAFGLSVVSLLVHWMKRAENPATAHLEAELAEVSEKLYSFMKREAARSRREKRAIEEGQDQGSPEIVPHSDAQDPFQIGARIPNHLAARYRDKIAS